MAKLVNRARMDTATTGTGDITLGSAVTGFQSFEDAGIVDGDLVCYVVEDGNAWEIHQGVYTGSGTVLDKDIADTFVESSTGGLLNLSGSAEVGIMATAGDLRMLSFRADVIFG